VTENCQSGAKLVPTMHTIRQWCRLRLASYTNGPFQLYTPSQKRQNGRFAVMRYASL